MQIQAEQQAAHDQARIQEMQMDTINRAKDRESREKIETMQMLIEKDKHDSKVQLEKTKATAGIISDHLKHNSSLMQDHAKHKDNIILDHHKHITEILSDHHAQDKEHELRKQELKNKLNNTIDDK